MATVAIHMTCVTNFTDAMRSVGWDCSRTSVPVAMSLRLPASRWALTIVVSRLTAAPPAIVVSRAQPATTSAPAAAGEGREGDLAGSRIEIRGRAAPEAAAVGIRRGLLGAPCLLAAVNAHSRTDKPYLAEKSDHADSLRLRRIKSDRS